MESKFQIEPDTTRNVHTVESLPVDEDHLIPARDLPLYTAVARQTHARWRHEGVGPSYVRLGGRVFYRAGDIRAWIREHIRINTVKE